MISVQFKMTAVAFAESLKETKSQDRHNIFPGKPSRGRKPNKNFLCIRCIKDNPKIGVLLLLSYLSLSYVLQK